MKFKLSDMFQVLYISTFMLSGAYIWLACIQWFIFMNETELALWLFFSVPAGILFYNVYVPLRWFKK